jgi:zona occludens toxin
MTAPVTLLTGLPGNGKTLHAVCMVKEWAEKENRQVYYHGIEITDKQALPWEEFQDATTWHKLPVGSIIVIDEAHKVFPVRPVGSKVPPHVEAIAELRHQGHNLVIITQHPMEIDSAIRRRVGRHMHHVRRFGAQACAVFEWSRCVENCDKTRKDAIQHEWLYKKAAYGWYKSSELHTIKRSIPKKLIILAIAPLLIIAAIWYVVHIFNKQRDGGDQQAAPAVQAQQVQPGQAQQQQGRAGPLTTAEWHQAHQPRVHGLAYTAPVYDSVTQPVRAPYPAACISSATRCQCYTQQGTRLDVPGQLCKDIAAGGFFVAWQLDGAERQDIPPQATKAQ